MEKQNIIANKPRAITLVAALALAGVAWWLYGPVSNADYSKYGAECRRWISENYGDSAPAIIHDARKKRGKLIFTIAVRKSDKTLMDIYPCIVDKRKGTLWKPSAFDNSWR